MLFVPAKLTYMLQVLDFAVFAQFKKTLHETHAIAHMKSATAKRDLTMWVDATVTAVRRTFETAIVWPHFRSAGQWLKSGPYRSPLLQNSWQCLGAGCSTFDETAVVTTRWSQC